MKKFFSLIAVAMMMSAVANAEGKMTTEMAGTPAPAPMTTKVMFENNNHKVTYIKDDHGRVINKIVYQSVNGQWEPLGAYSVYYGEDETVLSYSRWDCVSHTFTANGQQTRYDSKEFPVIIIVPTK